MNRVLFEVDIGEDVRVMCCSYKELSDTLKAAYEKGDEVVKIHCYEHLWSDDE